jgi:hypothetical protein
LKNLIKNPQKPGFTQYSKIQFLKPNKLSRKLGPKNFRASKQCERKKTDKNVSNLISVRKPVETHKTPQKPKVIQYLSSTMQRPNESSKNLPRILSFKTMSAEELLIKI